MNAFLRVLEVATESRWCVRPYCTTCGATEFRAALRQLSDRTSLAYALSSVDLTALEDVVGWQDAVRLALDELHDAQQKDQVLTAWLPVLGAHVRLADLILFYYVRRGALFAPMSVDVLRRWLSKCIELALQTRDESLVESVVYTLGERYEEHGAFAALACELASKSRRVALALERQRRAV